MTQRLVLAITDPEIGRHAAALAEEAADIELVEHVTDLGRLTRVLRRSTPDVLVLHDARGVAATSDLTRELTAGFPDVAIVVVVAELSPELMRAGIQAGARDVLGARFAVEELESSARAAADWARTMRERVGAAESEAARAGARSGRIVTVAGAKGGVGTSTVAMHLALTAQAGEAGSVCLVDFDLQTGDLRAYLNLPHRRSVVDLVDVADELSLRHLNETLFTHRTGVSVLLAPDEGELAEDVKVDVARNVLAALRTRHDLVIVDAGAAIGDASAAAVELADLVLLVTTPDVPSLRGARRMLDLWERLQITSSDTRLLINRHSRQREVQGRLVRTYVDRPTVETKLPASFSALEDAANTGTPERVEDKGLVKAFRALAQELELIAPSSGKRRAPAPQVVDDAADPDAPPPSKPGLLSRLAGERGQASVETVAILPIVIVVGLLMWQIGLIGYTFILAGQSAREGARALAVGDDEAERIREDVPGAWRDGLRCDIGDDRVKVSLAVPVLVPGVETNVRIASSAGTSVEDDAVGSPERGDDRFKPKSAKQDPCADKDKSKKKKDAEDSEA